MVPEKIKPSSPVPTATGQHHQPQSRTLPPDQDDRLVGVRRKLRIPVLPEGGPGKPTRNAEAYVRHV